LAETLSCDVAVIGAGTAGLSAERAAREAGARTLLIDPAFAGTVCATVGCMPSKLLIAAGRRAEAVRSAGLFGLATAPPGVDGKAVMDRLRRVRDGFVDGVLDTFASLPDGTQVKARARLTGPTQLALDDGRSVSAGAIVIATGAEPAIPEPFKGLGELALTNRTVFDMEDLPGSLAVIGAGPIGLELAQALARLGVEVHVLDKARRLDVVPDNDLEPCIRDLMQREFALTLGAEIEAERRDGRVRLCWSGGDTPGEALFDRVLIAAGRPPSLEGLGLAAAGLECDETGVPLFNRQTLQCGEAPVFLAGDATGRQAVLHVASTEGAIAGRNAACWPDLTAATRSPAFSLVFTEPAIAVLGAPPDDDSLTGAADFSGQGRARVDAVASGGVRLYAEPTKGRLTGAVLACPGAEHLAHLIAWAIQRGETASGMLSLPFYHPTLEEGLKGALKAICAAVPEGLPQDRDHGDPPGA